MASFSFDILCGYDKAEMNNVVAATEKEIANRYDFKNTPAKVEWLDNKSGVKIIGANKWQCDAILDIMRKKLASREQSSKVLDLSKDPVESNLKTTWDIPFKQSFSHDDAKKITKLLKDKVPKVNAQIQGDIVRVASSSKDELQKAMAAVKNADFDLPLQFINYR